jgi:hypothetical protein
MLAGLHFASTLQIKYSLFDLRGNGDHWNALKLLAYRALSFNLDWELPEMMIMLTQAL